MLNYDPQFPYVNAWHRSAGKWQRIKCSDMDEFAERYHLKDVHFSIQQYKAGDIPPSGEKEIHSSPFVIDIDNKSFEKAHEEAKKVLQYLVDTLRIMPPYPRVWFSGNKGFHILVHPKTFNMKPDQDLNEMCKIAGEHIQGVINGVSLDGQVYGKVHLIRYQNTQHPKSQLWKTELTHDQLMNMSSADIRKYAKTRREPLDERWEPVATSMVAQAWWAAIEKHWRHMKDARKMSPTRPIKQISGHFAPCFMSLKDEEVEDGLRNRITYTMSAFLNDQGYSEQDTLNLMMDWVRDHFGDKEPHKLRERESNTAAVVRTVYNSNYHFSCSGCLDIRPGIDCPGKERCQFVEDVDDQVPEETPLVSLAESRKEIYYGTTVRVPINVTNVEDQPYSVPKAIIMKCRQPGDPALAKRNCSVCGMNPLSVENQGKKKNPNLVVTEEDSDGEGNTAGDYAPKEFMAKENIVPWKRDIMDYFKVGDKAIRKAIRGRYSVPGICNRLHIDFPQTMNVHEIGITPLVDTELDIPHTDDQYVLLRAYTVGKALKANQKYIAHCVNWTDPNDGQKQVQLIHKVEHMQEPLETFDPPIEVLERLKVFQPSPDQSIRDKFEEIHKDLSLNIYRIYGRHIYAWGVDLVYHSALNFYFRRKEVQKGWLEMSVVGDTSQGKSEVIKMLRKHYQLGEVITAEGKKRTSMSFAKLQFGNKWYVKWGYFPSNDRKLLVIDEFSGMDQSDFGELTSARSTGIMEASGAVNEETYCRTRAIYLSNPRSPNNKSEEGVISDYNYGYEALKDLYKSPADFRRVDFGVVLKSGVVTRAMQDAGRMMEEEDTEHIYTTDLCKNLILWAWTRSAANITFAPGVEKLIQELSVNIINEFGEDTALVDVGSQELKLARMAVATAIRVFSCDESYNNVVVTKEHVRFAADFMRESYTSDDMEYDMHVKWTKDEHLKPRNPDTPEEMSKRILDILKKKEDHDDFVMYLMDTDNINHQDMMEIYGMTKQTSMSLLRFCKSNSILNRNGRKTKLGRSIIKSLLKGVKKGPDF